MKKITYLALHLGFGGVEKAIINQANILSEFYNIEIISAYKLHEKPPFWVDPRVTIRYLMNDKPNKEQLKQAIKQKRPVAIIKQGIYAIGVLYKRTSLMKKAIKQSDSNIIISSRFLYNKILIKNARKNTVTIAQEHCHHNQNEKYIKKLLKSVALMDFFMPVSKELTDFYANKLVGKKVECVYIPHNLDYWPEQLSNLSEKSFISIGRLSREKGFFDLIKTMQPVLDKHKDWVLHIIGDGEEKEKIQTEINQLNLQKQVVLHGFKQKDFVNEMLSKSSIYVMASLEESFGIVLIEAQSFGLPCVAFDTAQGANEIIQNKENGYLVPNRDKQMFAEYVESLVKDNDLRLSLGKQARINAQKYKQNAVKEKWHSFINKII